MRARPYLKSSTWLSSREAKELFFWFIRWGQHEFHHLRQLSDIDVEEALKDLAYPTDCTIHNLQNNPHYIIPYFENTVSSKSAEINSTSGVTVTVNYSIEGVHLPAIETKGVAQIRLDHKSKFYTACQYRDLAIRESNIDHIYSMLVSGIASIESYMNIRAFIYEKKTGTSIVKNIEKDRTPLKEKIIKWTPLMDAHLFDFENSDILKNFDILSDIRNNQAIHYKIGKNISSLDEAADVINTFRLGIAGLMVALNQSFREHLDSDLIRAMLYPKVSAIYPPPQN